MMLVLAQAVAGPALPVNRRPAAMPCPTDGGDDVVVCARPQDHYRLKPLPPRPDEPAIPKEEISLGQARLAAEVEQVTLAAGQQSQRLILRLKLPIGRTKK